VAGFIILQDGRAYAAASWAYDAVVERIADALPPSAAGQALAVWLREQTCLVRGPGMGRVDLRELTVENQRLFGRAAQRAFTRALLGGPAGWGDPSFYPGWMRRFRDLTRMMRCVRRREPPEAFNPHMRGLIPPTGERAGPGWNVPTAGD
jgi:hypothetical protein